VQYVGVDEKGCENCPDSASQQIVGAKRPVIYGSLVDAAYPEKQCGQDACKDEVVAFAQGYLASLTAKTF
jgi:hypothetical protein